MPRDNFCTGIFLTRSYKLCIFKFNRIEKQILTIIMILSGQCGFQINLI